MSGFINAGYFLFSISCNLLIFVLWLRVAIRYLHISALHINKLTTPLLQPLEELPALSALKSRRYDGLSLLLIALIELAKFTVISYVLSSVHLSFTNIIALTLADMIIQPCHIVFAAIILRVVMSWVNPSWQHPIADLAFIISDPLFVAIRRHVPIVAGLDFSPLIALILLKTISLFVSAYVPFGLV